MPSLGRPGGVKIPTNFLQGNDVQGLGCIPVQELVMDQVLRGIPGHLRGTGHACQVLFAVVRDFSLVL